MSKKRVNLADVLKPKTGHRHPKIASMPKVDLFAELKGVEVFVSGTHRGKTYSDKDLADMEANFKRFSTGENAKVRVPAVIGHEENQEFLKRTDLPAAGWLTSLGNGTDGVQRADVAEVAKPVAALITARRYRKVSPEVYDAPPEGVPGNRLAIIEELKARGRDAAADLEEAKAWADAELPKRMEVWQNRKAGYDAGTLEKQPGPAPERESLIDERLRGHFGKMLRRLSFLGGEIPQIKSLADIPMPTEAYSERPVELSLAEVVEHDGAWACFFETRKYCDTPEGQALKKYTDEFVKRFCDKGKNAGKPGPCPDFSRSVGRGAIRGALSGAAVSIAARKLAQKAYGPGVAGVLTRQGIAGIADSGLRGAALGAGAGAILHLIRKRMAKANKNAEKFAEPGKKRFHFGVSPGLKRLGLMAAGAGIFAVGSKTKLGRSLFRRSGLRSPIKRAAKRLDRIGAAFKKSAMSYRPGIMSEFAESKFRKVAKVGAGLALGAALAHGGGKLFKAGRKFHKANKLIMRRLPPVFKHGERFKSFAKSAAVIGLGAVMSKTRAAGMIARRGNKLAMRGAKFINRGHAFLRKTTGFRFAEDGNFAIVVKPGSRLGEALACIRQGKPSGTTSLGRGCGDAPRKFCDRGQNAGKPGPCPEPGNKLKTLGIATAGALTGAALASTPLGRKAIGSGLKFGKANVRRFLTNKGSVAQRASQAVASAVPAAGKKFARKLVRAGVSKHIVRRGPMGAVVAGGLLANKVLGVDDAVKEFVQSLKHGSRRTARELAVRASRTVRRKLPGAEDKRAEGGKFAVGNLGGPGRPRKKKPEDGTPATSFGEMVRKFCSTGPNAGKPGPCPEFAGRRAVARATGQAKSLGRIEAAANQPGIAGRAVGAVKAKIASNYARLSARYGPKYAKAIIGAAIAGAPIPIPGSMAITAAPVLAIAEGHKRLGGAFGNLASRAVRLAPRMAFKERLAKHCETGVNAGKPGPCPQDGGLKRKALIFGGAALAGAAAAYHPTGRKLIMRGRSLLRRGVKQGVTSRGSLLKQFVGTKSSRLAARSVALKNAQAAVRTAGKSQKVAIGGVSDALGLQSKAARAAGAAEAAARSTSSAKFTKKARQIAERAAKAAQKNVVKSAKGVQRAENEVRSSLSRTIAAQRKAAKLAARLARLKSDA